MNDFLSRVEAILSGVMNFNPKSRVERLLMKWVGSVGNVEDLETYDKSSLVAAINEVAESGGGGTGWTTAQIDLLEAVFEKLVYTDAEGGVIAAQLINSLRGGVVPEEPIAITFDGTTAKISGLNSLNINYSGTTAEIGG